MALLFTDNVLFGGHYVNIALEGFLRLLPHGSHFRLSFLPRFHNSEIDEPLSFFLFKNIFPFAPSAITL